jgi:hypothetical protein
LRTRSGHQRFRAARSPCAADPRRVARNATTVAARIPAAAISSKPCIEGNFWTGSCCWIASSASIDAFVPFDGRIRRVPATVLAFSATPIPPLS